MLKNYAKYSKKIEKFKQEIYFYCDYNVGLNVLFPAFVNLWPENTGQKVSLSKKDLAIITSSILYNLEETENKKEILVEIPKDENFHSPYALYKILPHENLMKYNPLIEKKMELIKLLNSPIKKG